MMMRSNVILCDLNLLSLLQQVAIKQCQSKLCTNKELLSAVERVASASCDCHDAEKYCYSCLIVIFCNNTHTTMSSP